MILRRNRQAAASSGASDREARRSRVAAVISRNEVHTQEQLAALLEAEGVVTNQPTLSRDLRALGIIKTPDGYVVPARSAERRPAIESLQQALQASDTRQITHGGTNVVIRCRCDAATGAARAIDAADLPQVLGTIAGSDTVFIATRDAPGARVLAAQLRRWTGVSSRG